MYGKSSATPNTAYTCIQNLLLHHIPCKQGNLLLHHILCTHGKSIVTPNTLNTPKIENKQQHR